MPTEYFSGSEMYLVIMKAVGNVSDISFSKCNWFIPVLQSMIFICVYNNSFLLSKQLKPGTKLF